MKKLLVALTAALGLASAAVPASAGGSYSISAGFYTAPSYSSYNYYTPRYTPTYSYVSPRYSYVAPTYYTTTPIVSYSFGSSYYKPQRAYRGHGKYRGHRHHRRRHGYRW